MNHTLSYRIIAPNARRRNWAIVVTTRDELGTVSHRATAPTYDEAATQIRRAVEFRQEVVRSRLMDGWTRERNTSNEVQGEAFEAPSGGFEADYE